MWVLMCSGGLDHDFFYLEYIKYNSDMERRVRRRLGITEPLRVLDESDYADDISFLNPEEELPSEQESNAFIDNMDIYNRATYDLNPRGTSLYFQARSLLPPEVMRYMGTQVINERLRAIPISFRSKCVSTPRGFKLLIVIYFNCFDTEIRDGRFNMDALENGAPHGQSSIVHKLCEMTSLEFRPTRLVLRGYDPNFGRASYDYHAENDHHFIAANLQNLWGSHGGTFEQRAEYHTQFLTEFIREFEEFIRTNERGRFIDTLTSSRLMGGDHQNTWFNVRIVEPVRVIAPLYINNEAREVGGIIELSVATI